MATKLEKTRDEQEQDELLAKFGFVDGEPKAAPTEEGGSVVPEDDPAGLNAAGDPAKGGESAGAGTEGAGSGVDAGGDNPTGTPDEKPPLKGWEKRAADNQHNYHLERNAREKVEKVANELKAELDRQRSTFADLLEKLEKGKTESKPEVPSQEDALDADYPEISAGVKDKLAPLTKKIADLESKIAKTETKTVIDTFLDKVASPEGGNIPEIRSIVADPDFNKWLDDTGGYAERVMRQTFNKEFGFSEKDVAEVVGRWMAATGRTPNAAPPAKKDTPPERPRIPSGSGGLKGAESADIFTQEEMGNLRALADQAGRAFAKGFDKDALTKFDDKLSRSIAFYDKKPK